MLNEGQSLRSIRNFMDSKYAALLSKATPAPMPPDNLRSPDFAVEVSPPQQDFHGSGSPVQDHDDWYYDDF